MTSIKDAGLGDNLIDLGYCDHKTAVKEQKEASVLILPLRKEPEYRATLPGKLFEYLASERPVLGIGQTDGAMAAILEDTKTGMTYDWEDLSAITRYIKLCWQMHLKGNLTVESEDIEKYSSITNVKVTDITNNKDNLLMELNKNNTWYKISVEMKNAADLPSRLISAS